MWHWSFPKLFPAAGKAEKVRCWEREWVCLHRCGKEGWSPREIGLHQFLLITQSFCYVGLVAKSVEGSHMVKRRKKKRNKNTLVLLVRKYSSNISLQYCWGENQRQHKPQSTVTARASPLQVPPSASMVSRGPCLHVSGGSHPRRCSHHRDSLTSSARTKSPISAGEPVPPPAAP